MVESKFVESEFVEISLFKIDSKIVEKGWLKIGRIFLVERSEVEPFDQIAGRDRMECGRILSYLLYGSAVASLPSPSSNIEACHMARRSASLRSCIQGTRDM